MNNCRRLKDATWELQSDDDSWIPLDGFNKFINTSSIVVMAQNNINVVPPADVVAAIAIHDSGCDHLAEDGAEFSDLVGWNELYPNLTTALDGLYEYSQELLQSENGDDFQFSEDGVMLGYVHLVKCTDHTTSDKELEKTRDLDEHFG